MIRSLYTGVTGLKSHQTKMDVIGNNISNVNTIAYKQRRATFSDILSQTMESAKKADEERGVGGKNPTQVGLGVKIASIDKKMVQGAAQITNNPFDVMIQDEGFFIVGAHKPEYLTRAGNFNFDAAGFLNMNGYKVYGWDAVYNDETKKYEIDTDSDITTPIQITPEKRFLEPEATTAVDFEGNLDAKNIEEKVETSINIYDSLGNTYSVPITFEYDEEDRSWYYDIARDSNNNRIAYRNGDSNYPVILGFSDNAEGDLEFTPLGGIAFDTNGRLSAIVEVSDEEDTQIDNNTPLDGDVPIDTNAPVDEELKKRRMLKQPEEPKEGKFQVELFVNILENSDIDPDASFGAENKVILDFTNLTQFASSSTVKTNALDGNEKGTLKDINFGNDGTVYGSYTNGLIRPLGQIALCDVDNPAGLNSVGDNLYTITSNSGGYDKENGELKTMIGKMQGGALEMSNVDLGDEFTDMITTQRGFQANSKIITVSDEMLQEAIQMKR